MEDNLQKIFLDEKLLKEFLSQKDIQSAKEFLKSHNVEVSTQQLQDLAKILVKLSNVPDEEIQNAIKQLELNSKQPNNISDDELDNVVGGTNTEISLRKLSKILFLANIPFSVINICLSETRHERCGWACALAAQIAYGLSK